MANIIYDFYSMAEIPILKYDHPNGLMSDFINNRLI
jgi:hypothetical protein